MAYENLKQMRAFEMYYAMPNRSYRALAEKLGLSVTTIALWGSNFDWKRRVAIRDLEEAARLREMDKVNKEDEQEKYRKIIQASLASYVDQLRRGNVKVTKVSDVVKLMDIGLRLAETDKDTSGISDDTKKTIGQLINSINNLMEDDGSNTETKP